MNEEYISITEFAERAGVSRSYIYKLLSTKLSTYCRQVDNIKMLNIKALALFDVYSNVYKETEKETDGETLKEIVEILREQQKSIKAELEIKNKQIESLTTLLDQQQKLHALEIQGNVQIQEKIEPDSDPGEMTPEQEREELRRLLNLLPPLPSLFGISDKEIENWSDERDRRINGLKDWEKNLLVKKGFCPRKSLIAL